MNISRIVTIVVPIYCPDLSYYEKLSLQQVCSVLGRYPITVIKPKGLDIKNILERYPQLQVEEFDKHYFQGISGYNELMMSAEFYRRFLNSHYILIYQLDAYVFRDELEMWCSKGYDYIGAPWLVRPIYRFPLLRLTSWMKKQICRLLHLPNSQITNFRVGNGGLSLRKVESHLKVVIRLENVIREYLRHPGNHIYHEDVFFAVEVNRHGMNFVYPDYREALRFSFDKYPELCYQVNEKQMPFGCHSWYKRRMKNFWLPIITAEEKVERGNISWGKRCVAFVKSRYFYVCEMLSPNEHREVTEIPIVINNFNRLTTLQQLIASLEQRGYRNIYILDNASTYPPLLEYYQVCPYEVIHLGENLGFKALWKKKSLRKRFCCDYYIYTDSDVVLDEACPSDVISHLYVLLKEKYRYAAKIGLSLRIDNLPDCYAQKAKVITWENRYWKNQNEDRLYSAPVDTTFALYRPRVGLSRSRAIEAYRTAMPYSLLHLPWYSDSTHLTEEETYYIEHCSKVTAWSALGKKSL